MVDCQINVDHLEKTTVFDIYGSIGKRYLGSDMAEGKIGNPDLLLPPPLMDFLCHLFIGMPDYLKSDNFKTSPSDVYTTWIIHVMLSWEIMTAFGLRKISMSIDHILRMEMTC